MKENISEIIERIKSIERVSEDVEVAKILDITKQNLSNYKRDGRIPRKKIRIYCENRGLSVYFVLAGEGNMFSSDFGVAPEPTITSISDRRKVYDRRKPVDSASPSCSSILIPDLLSKTKEILESDTRYSPALKQNIEAFYEGLKDKDNIESQRKLIESMDARLKLVESKLLSG